MKRCGTQRDNNEQARRPRPQPGRARPHTDPRPSYYGVVSIHERTQNITKRNFVMIRVVLRIARFAANVETVKEAEAFSSQLLFSSRATCRNARAACERVAPLR